MSQNYYNSNSISFEWGFSHQLQDVMLDTTALSPGCNRTPYIQAKIQCLIARQLLRTGEEEDVVRICESSLTVFVIELCPLNCQYFDSFYPVLNFLDRHFNCTIYELYFNSYLILIVAVEIATRATIFQLAHYFTR